MDIAKYVPAGFKFDPTDEELIMCYLVPKLNGMPLPCGIVTDKVVYGENSTPWEIFDDQKDPWIQSPKCKNKKTIYVFTKLKKKSKGKKQMERTAGCGTWDGQTAPRIIKDGHGKIIGSRKYFSFESRKYGNDKQDYYIRNYGHWGMHEFSISDGGEYVLCAITRDDSKRLVKLLHQVTPSGSIHREPLEELQVASEFDPKLLKDDTAPLKVPLGEEVASEFDPKLLKDDTAPLQVQAEVLDQRNAIGNWTESQGSTMIEYQGFGNPGKFQGSTMIEYEDFGNPGEFLAGSTMIDYNGFENPAEIQGSTMTDNDGFENPDSFENLGEFQGPAMMDYGQQLGDFTVSNLQNQGGEDLWDDDIFDSSFLDAMPISRVDDTLDFSFLDGISMDEIPEPLLWENQVLGKRKLLEEAENPCGKKLCGPHM